MFQLQKNAFLFIIRDRSRNDDPSFSFLRISDLGKQGKLDVASTDLVSFWQSVSSATCVVCERFLSGSVLCRLRTLIKTLDRGCLPCLGQFQFVTSSRTAHCSLLLSAKGRVEQNMPSQLVNAYMLR